MQLMRKMLTDDGEEEDSSWAALDDQVQSEVGQYLRSLSVLMPGASVLAPQRTADLTCMQRFPH